MSVNHRRVFICLSVLTSGIDRHGKFVELKPECSCQFAVPQSVKIAQSLLTGSKPARTTSKYSRVSCIFVLLHSVVLRTRVEIMCLLCTRLESSNEIILFKCNFYRTPYETTKLSLASWQNTRVTISALFRA